MNTAGDWTAPWGRTALVVALVAALATACSSEADPTVALGPVRAGEVVATVAAPASLEPRDRVVVQAPASGTVAELLVEDGDVVAAGDPVLRLTAPSIDQTIAQAEAAVSAADALAGVETGLDLSPVFGAVSSQPRPSSRDCCRPSPSRPRPSPTRPPASR